MNNRKSYENVLNVLVKKKYPFIEEIEVYRIKSMNSFNLDLEVNLYLTRDNMIKLVDYDCIDQIPNHESIFMSLFSFGLCSKNKINRKEFEEYLLTIYEMTVNTSKILVYNPVVSVIAPDINGEF